MKIVEYAIKIRDMGSAQLASFGRKVSEQNNKTREYASKVQQLNKFYGSSYTELQQKIQETENVIRNSVLKSEIRQARQELAALQRQSAHHKGNSATVGGGASSGGGMGAGMAMGALMKGGAVVGAVIAATAAVKNFATEAQQAYIIQDMAEQKLAVIMRQRMGASNDQINSVKQLAAEQQKVGVIGDEVQLAGGQQLGTFLNKTESLKTLLPAMNNLLAQQKGLNATDQDAVNVGNLMGKVMQGQTGALRRAGVSFSEAEEKVLKFGNEQERAAKLAQVIKNNVGDMNKELAKTDLGKLKQDSNNDGDLMERFGQLATKMQVALLPLDDVADSVMESFIPIIADFIPTLQTGVLWIVEAINTAKPYLAEMVAPAVALWEQLKGSASGFKDYIAIAGNFITQHLWPVVSRIVGAIMRIVGDIIAWVAKSQLIKDIFNAIYTIVGGVVDLIGEIIKAFEWMWDKVVKPILDAVEKVYQWIRGGGEIKITGKTADGKEMKASINSQSEATKENTKLLGDIVETTKGNATAAGNAESAITGGAQKTVTINISKFFDNINIHAASVTESTADIEEAVLQCMARILNQGTTSLST